MTATRHDLAGRRRLGGAFFISRLVEMGDLQRQRRLRDLRANDRRRFSRLSQHGRRREPLRYPLLADLRALPAAHGSVSDRPAADRRAGGRRSTDRHRNLLLGAAVDARTASGRRCVRRVRLPGAGRIDLRRPVRNGVRSGRDRVAALRFRGAQGERHRARHARRARHQRRPGHLSHRDRTLFGLAPPARAATADVRPRRGRRVRC